MGVDSLVVRLGEATTRNPDEAYAYLHSADLLDDSTVVFTDEEGRVSALGFDGSLLWRTEGVGEDPFSHRARPRLQVSDGSVMLFDASGYRARLDPATGAFVHLDPFITDRIFDQGTLDHVTGVYLGAGYRVSAVAWPDGATGTPIVQHVVQWNEADGSWDEIAQRETNQIHGGAASDGWFRETYRDGISVRWYTGETTVEVERGDEINTFALGFSIGTVRIDLVGRAWVRFDDGVMVVYDALTMAPLFRWAGRTLPHSATDRLVFSRHSTEEYPMHSVMSVYALEDSL